MFRLAKNPKPFAKLANKAVLQGPRLVHTPHGTIYKGVEGTFV